MLLLEHLYSPQVVEENLKKIQTNNLNKQTKEQCTVDKKDNNKWCDLANLTNVYNSNRMALSSLRMYSICCLSVIPILYHSKPLAFNIKRS